MVTDDGAEARAILFTAESVKPSKKITASPKKRKKKKGKEKYRRLVSKYTCT